MFHHNKLITTANCFNDKKKTNDILCESIVKVFFLMNKYFD